MLGFSLYLNRVLTADDYNYLIAMRNAGFSTVYTTIEIDNLEAELLTSRLKEVAKWCQNLDLDLVATVSEASLAKISVAISDVGKVQSLNLAGIFLNGPVKPEIVAKLSKSLPVALRAESLTDDQLVQLKEYNAAVDHLSAWYNYYEYPDTGLDENWFSAKNRWLKEHGLTITAFAPGDGQLTGPVMAGRPSLEKPPR
ncbi:MULTISPECIES: MupG family TIM beta-alpha barrel fold protein [Lactobacillus]|uniref:MupG family TIM beta-alpha barrel fold protein n=1 Tax=Lactobacillus TaxID=1578 RepID=UPI001F2A8D8F|nr:MULTISPECIES: MupG family TIM beta-alpha barrel fold protein [Lactobacillus]